MLFFRLTSVKISFSKVNNTIGYHIKDYYGKKTRFVFIASKIYLYIFRFKLAVATFIEAKNRIMEACFFTKGN
jgi:hypothetical protein